MSLVWFAAGGEPLDADTLDVPNAAASPAHFIRDHLRDLGAWPVGATGCKGFFDALSPPIYVQLPTRAENIARLEPAR